MQAGIWGGPGSGLPTDPTAFAQQLARLSQTYRPSLLVPDIEFAGKGYQGSPGWQWNQTFANSLHGLLPNQRVGLTVMPNQEDFNYEAYLRNGVNTFLPQSYGATYATKFNPASVVATLIKRGVPASQIQPVLAPGQTYGGPASYYTLDDIPAGQLPRGTATVAPPNPRLAQAAALIQRLRSGHL